MSRIVLSVGHVVLAGRDPFGLWHELNGDPDQRDRPDAFSEFLVERGIAWEQQILSRRHTDFLDLSDLSFTQALEETRRALRSDSPPIYQGALDDETLGVRGRPDLLVPFAGSIRVEEYKLAGHTKVDHLTQAMIYADLAERQSGKHADAVVVTRVGNETHVERDSGAVRDAVRRAREIVEAPEPPAPVYNCRESRWKSLQDEEAKRRRHVSLAVGVGPSMVASLQYAGLNTLEAIARADDQTLMDLPGVGRRKLTKIRRSANALVRDEVQRIGPWTVEADTPALELFIDLEGSGELFQDDPSWNCLYLTGVIPRERTGGEAAYESFMAGRPDQEGIALGAFLEYLEGLGGYALYHWSHYERTELRKTCERHGWLDRYENLIGPHLVDLCDKAQRAFVLPLPGWSVKLVAPYFGFHWTYGADEIGAMTSAIVWFRQAEAGGKGEGLDKVLQYNEDDCRAMIAVKDGLARLDRDVPWEGST